MRPIEEILRTVLEGFEDGDGVIRDVKTVDIIEEFERALAEEAA